jgi:hypothetical protein
VAVELPDTHDYAGDHISEVDELLADSRDSGKIIHLYGTLFSNVPEYNRLQVQVDRIEIE